jgi:hypothetical protein
VGRGYPSDGARGLFLGDKCGGGSGKERSLHEEFFKSVRSHYWIQWKKENEWTDLDPSFSDFRMGQSATKMKAVVENPSAQADRYSLTLQVERKSGESKEVVTVLQYEGAVHETLLRPLRLMIQPTKWNPDPTERLTEEEMV